MLGFHCCMDFFLVVESKSYSLAAVCRLLIVAASFIVQHGLWGTQSAVAAALGLSSCSSWALEHSLNSLGARAQLLHGMWGLPKSEIEPTSSALSGKFFTAEPPGKQSCQVCVCFNIYNFIYYIFGYAGSSFLQGLFSSCGEQGLISSCGSEVPHCSSFSCCRAWVLGHVGFSSCSTWTQPLQVMWHLSRSGI